MHNIPTTIVTGFLGAGKTTAINHLLAQKPHREHWAVLVNEFGKVGVDAALIGPVAGVSIREIAGGCLCCTAQVAFEVALNRLIRDTSPDRILIEPTGIGHPLKIITTLTGGYYHNLLDLKATISLVDARKLSDPRYLKHHAFQDQLNLADVLVGNKAECYTDTDRSAFMELVLGSTPPKAAYSMISFGRLDSSLLDLPRLQSRMPGFPEAHPAKERHLFLPAVKEIPEGKTDSMSRDLWTMHEGSSGGYFSASWLIGSDYSFNSNDLSALLSSLPYSRIKGIVKCNDGWLKINGSDGIVHFSASEPQANSRLEIINSSPIPCREIEKELAVGSRQLAGERFLRGCSK